MHPDDCSMILRRFVGPQANELTILCRPGAHPREAVRQAEAVYRALARGLDAERASFRELTCETVFLRDVRRELPLVLEARARVLADIGQHPGAPLPSFIGQAPLAPGASFELSAQAVVPHRHDAGSVRNVRAIPSCGCEGCARSGGRLVQLGDEVSLHTTNVYGAGEAAFEQARDMFRAAERLLAQCDLGFRDVIRTWIHVRDIDRDYAALNRARREFFELRGLVPPPASTGVQGIPWPDAHDVSLTLHAVKSAGPLHVAPMSSPMLNEASSYGADFSRGVRVTDANKVALHVSGTASVDEAGRTAHVGNLTAQVDRMLANIASLLAAQGATFEHVVSGVTYLKDARDAPAVRSLFRQRGFDGFPCVLVLAPLCRPELLCEAEAVALLPLATSGA